MHMRKFLLGFAALLCFVIAKAQTTTVTGKVTDEKGAAIAGASVIEKGTKNGTAAANDGTFSLSVKPKAILVITALGFDSKEVKATDNLAIT